MNDALPTRPLRRESLIGSPDSTGGHSSPAKAKRGRPSKYTKAIVKRFLRCIEHGLTVKMACRVVGIGERTYSGYLEQHGDFKEKIEQARARGADERMKIVLKASKSKDLSLALSAAKWWLEHVLPDQFSRSRLELSGADGKPLAAAVAVYLPQKDRPVVEVTANPLPKQIEK